MNAYNIGRVEYAVWAIGDDTYVMITRYRINVCREVPDLS
jgi:hypothetical protein